MQTQVGVQPRTGREQVWQYQVYRSADTGPFDQGSLFDFEDVLRKIGAVRGPGILVRIIGPSNASKEQLDKLRELGAHPTFPPP
jgi:hypothetical protein